MPLSNEATTTPMDDPTKPWREGTLSSTEAAPTREGAVIDETLCGSVKRRGDASPLCIHRKEGASLIGRTDGAESPERPTPS